MNYGTLPSKFLHALETWPSSRAQMHNTGAGWQHISSEEFLRRTAGLSQALFELGIKPGDRVGLYASNRPEWHTSDFAINGNGGVTVPVYFKESPERAAYILNHSESRVVIVVGTDQLISLLAIRNDLPSLEHIIVADAGANLPSDCLRYETLIATAGGAEMRRIACALRKCCRGSSPR